VNIPYEHAWCVSRQHTKRAAMQVISTLVAVALIAGIGGGGYVYRDSIKEGISWFISVVSACRSSIMGMLYGNISGYTLQASEAVCKPKGC
jgi:hypothetical protein